MRTLIGANLTRLAGLFALTFAFTVTVQADQTFVCDDGSTIKVAFQNLENLKRTNSCVAGYFGLTATKIGIPPLPERRVANRASSTLTPVPQPLNTAKHQARLSAPMTTGTTPHRRPNFRKVEIINAGPGSARIFHHRY